MFVMTTKVDKKKMLIAVIGVVVAVIAVIALLGGKDTQTSATNTVTGNDDRVQFITSFGWEVVTSPVESGQVRIPAEGGEVFHRYNQLQQSMGYDLSNYAGKTVMRYVYKVKNYPGATGDVYATLLISNNQVIGGDITDTTAGGKIQGFQKDAE